jgi:hypothetical protein
VRDATETIDRSCCCLAHVLLGGKLANRRVLEQRLRRTPQVCVTCRSFACVVWLLGCWHGAARALGSAHVLAVAFFSLSHSFFPCLPLLDLNRVLLDVSAKMMTNIMVLRSIPLNCGKLRGATIGSLIVQDEVRRDRLGKFLQDENSMN